MELQSAWQQRSLFSWVVLLTCCFGGTVSSFAVDRKPAFVDPTIRFSANATRDVTVVKIKVDGLTKEELKSKTQPKLADATQPAPSGTVTFTFVKSENAGATSRIWYFTAAIEGLPSGQTQKRQATVQFESINEKTEYTLTNQATVGSNWTILPPPDPWVMTGWWPSVHCTAMSVIPGDSPATDLQLKQSGLIEQSTKKPLGLDVLRLCSDADGGHCGAFDLAPHSSAAPLYLCVTDEFHGHGNYRGALNLSALEKPETQTVQLNIYSSSFGAKLAGSLLIVAGVVLAWVTKVFASNRLTRDQELLPMTMLRRRLERLQAEITGLPDPYNKKIPEITREVKRLLDTELKTDKVDSQHHFIHPASPSPFNNVIIDSAGYKAFLSENDTKVNLLTVLLQEGVEPAIRMASQNATPQDIEAALGKIDALLTQTKPPSEADARAVITKQILPELADKILVASGVTKPKPEIAVPASFDRLLVEISEINLLVWGVASLLTSLVGMAVLVVNSPGFGVCLDYIYCVFWGFGIPAAVAQLTGSSATTALGVSVPK